MGLEDIDDEEIDRVSINCLVNDNYSVHCTRYLVMVRLCVLL